MRSARILLIFLFPTSSFSFAFRLVASPSQRPSGTRAVVATPLVLHRTICPDAAVRRVRHRATADPSSTSNGEASTILESHESEWIMKQGMLFSSFSDGVVQNPDAQNALRRGLVRSILRQMQKDAESQVHQSVLHSPCAGPNVQFLNRMEILDRALLEVSTCSDPLDALYRCLCELDENDSVDDRGLRSERKQVCVDLRFVYVPTAMYALRRDSTNTPGKQRQRARADAKKRRDDICDLVLNLFRSTSSESAKFLDVSLHVVTLDWDDGSLKHAAIVNRNDQQLAPTNNTHSPSQLPTTGKQAMSEWAPHLLYVQGGNTFWLHHCLEKGKWQDDLTNLVKDGTTFYCGSSAGAILAGRSMEVATWKEWDDCGIVPGRSQYRDWDRVDALGLVGPYSFFPHMTNDWQSLVDEKRENDETNSFVVCLRDQDVCLVDGSAQSLTVVSAPPPADFAVVEASIMGATAAAVA